MSEYDVAALVVYWKSRPSRYGRMKPQTVRKYIGILNKFLTWTGNPIITKMVEEGKLLIPNAPGPEIEILSDSDLLRLRLTAEAMDGWEGCVGRFLVAILPNSGLRRKEIRRARVFDLDTTRWTILVAHPKGEGSWAVIRKAPILPSARQAVLDYLDERKTYLRGQEHEALIPLRQWDGSLGYWSDGMFTKLKARLERESGVIFHLKTFRATFAQEAKDRGVSIEAVSRALGHRTTVTTERYYSRIRPEAAFAEFEQAFTNPKVRLT